MGSAAGKPAMIARLVGIVDSWDAPRGFGFVHSGRGKYFIHVSMLDAGTVLTPGAVVEFTPEAHERGPRATRLRRLKPECPKCSEPLRALACSACGFQLGA